MKQLSARQKQCLEYIKEYVEERGVAPTVREIEKEMGYMSPSSAQYVLNKLEEYGYIERDSMMKRTIRLKHYDTKAYQIPLVGTVTAGKPILAVESIEEYIPVPVKNKGKNMFALKVKGDSMINAAILDGDIVVVEQTPVAENGEIVVAMINGETTLKRFYKKNGKIILHPENKTMNDIIVKSCEIQGVLVSCIKMYI